MARRHQGTLSIALFVVALFLSRTVRADEWSRTDTAVEAGCFLLFLADWRQTLDRRYTESNAVLGPRPGTGAVTGYFLGAAALQLTAARLLPHPWRTLLQGVTIGAEARSVYNNWQLGARLLW